MSGQHSPSAEFGGTVAGPNDLRAQILRDYNVLEPGQSDSWNPVDSDHELGYRMSMLFAIARGLRLCEIDLADLRVLDVGSGTGRSTRAYIDLGLDPEQLVSVDFRPGAIERARSLHPTITYRICESNQIDYPDASFNWVQAAAVFSSIAGTENRESVAREMVRNVATGGYVLYFDLWRANWLAGHDVIDVKSLFRDLTIVWSSPLRARQCFPRVHDSRMRLPGQSRSEHIKSVIRPRTRISNLLHPSHYVLLARK